jgi:hypothetical protein
MNKYSYKLITALLLIVSSATFAGYIETDLTEDTYITYGGYDWTWASSVSTTTFEGIDPATNLFVTNIFEDPSVHAGWMFVEGIKLESLFAELTFANFQTNGMIIQSAAYWNSDFVHVDSFNFDDRTGIKTRDGSVRNYYETFYVRASIAQKVVRFSMAQTPAVVPEPTTLFIFAAGLVGFALRKRKIK